MNNRKFSVSVLVIFAMVQVFLNFGFANAASAGSVVINEVAWAGSVDSGNDEWIELYNTTGQAVDLTGWYIDDNHGAYIYHLKGTIPANGYYLIEDSEAVVQPVLADAVINVTLANSGASLVLLDAAGNFIDAVNSSGGAWAAGSATTRATMERISPLVSGDDVSNWVSSSGAGSTATGSLGSKIVGTPKMLNSSSQEPVIKSQALMSVSSDAPGVGDTITLTVTANNAANLFSYGSEIIYDPSVLAFKSADKGTFLSQSGSAPSSFQSGLEDSVEGKLLVAEARTQDVKSGVSGSGILFTVEFDVVGGVGEESVLEFGTKSFLADVSADLPADFSGAKFTPIITAADPVAGLKTEEDVQRYAIKLSWQAPAGGADKYKISRMNPHGDWVLLGETAQASFVDCDAILAGGKIIPSVEYKYKVTAVKGSAESVAVEVAGKDARGIKGDNDRSDRIDGRDLEKLARHFAEDDSQANFDTLADTTYDGLIDGSDLIDLGANFAKTYK